MVPTMNTPASRSWTPQNPTGQGQAPTILPANNPTQHLRDIAVSQSSNDRPLPSRSLTAGNSETSSERERRNQDHIVPPSMSKSEDLNHSKRSNYLDDFSQDFAPPPRPSSSSSHASASSSSSSAPRQPLTAASSTSSTLTTTTCNACGRPMQGPFVRALGTVFHLNCFKCLDCGDVVASKFFPIDGPDGKQSPLCERDYFRRLNLICAKCGTALRSSYITACNKKYHVEHFTCTLCDVVFGAQDSYYEHDGDVYCHFHYSTRFATKCAGCNSAILKQFVEINRNMRDECWHPECYMINKFWNVKVVTRRPQSAIGEGGELSEQQQQPVYLEEEKEESPLSLKDKQIRMEQQVYRIWTVLSAFEESSAACISDMLRQVSNGQYLDAIRMADKFILHVEVLFATIDDLEWHFARMNLKGMSHVREARMLCRKTVELFTLLSHTQETGARRMGMTQELLALVTGLAHYLKILIRIALTGALKLEREHNCREAMITFLDKLHLLAVQGGNPTAKRIVGHHGAEMVNSGISGVNAVTQGVTYGFNSLAPENAGDSPFSTNRDPSSKPTANPPSDLCIHCRKTVEEDCVRLGTYQRWHSQCIQCATCGITAAPLKEKEPPKISEDGERPAPKLSTGRKAPANVDFFLYDADSMRETSSFGEVPTVVQCSTHANNRCRPGFHAVPRLEQYAFLLNVALRRLYLLLKKQGVVPISPTGATSPQQDSEHYRSPSDILMKSRLDRKLSATARIPKRSTIVESPAGKSAQAGDMIQGQRTEQFPQKPSISSAAIVAPAQQGSVRQGQPRSPPQLYQQPAAVTGSKSTLTPESPQQLLRPSFARHNTGVMIREDNAPPSPVNEFPPPTQDDSITLADLANMMEAPKPSATPYLSELGPLEVTLVKYAALSALTRGPLRDQLEMDEILEMIEIKKSGFWNKLFKGDKKSVKKKGVFGVPLELLVEREGADSVLGVTGATMRIPSFIDDVVSAMRQMDMSIEGIFRKNGNIRRLKDLTENIDRDASAVDLTTDNPVQLAALLKKFLRDLPDPLMTFKLYRLLCATQSLSEGERQRQLHLVSLLLPKAHRDTMEVLFVFLKWVASFAHMDEETGSKMDLPNLATVICPSILYSRGRDAVRDDHFGAISVITELLEHQDDVFTVPPELMPILKEQEYFVNSTDLPSKDFLKKCDTYLKTRQSNGQRPGMNQFSNGSTRMQSPVPERPPLGMGSPSERTVRQHPGMPPGSMSFPPPSSPAMSVMSSTGLQSLPAQRPGVPGPEEPLSWTTPIPLPLPRPANPSATPSSRPSSYIQPRPPPAPPTSNNEGQYSPNGNVY